MSAAKTKKRPTKNPQRGGVLGTLGDLSGLLAPAPEEDGKIDISLNLIDEDPNQPRKEENPGFSQESIAEIAATIKTRGVKSPISVRENPNVPGRYIINHGARRYRGSWVAEKESIPAFIDNDYNEVDQVIENLQRNELTAREIANFIGRELAKGQKKGEIAKMIGKSAAFVTQHVTLLDLPDPIAEVFNTGRIKDVTVVNELVTAYKKNPAEVEAWLVDDNQELTRGTIKLLREFLEDKQNQELASDPKTVDAFTGQGDGGNWEPDAFIGGLSGNDTVAKEQDGYKNKAEARQGEKEQSSDKFKKAAIIVEHDKRLARLLINRRPLTEGWAWLKYEDGGQDFEADLSTVRIVALIES